MQTTEEEYINPALQQGSAHPSHLLLNKDGHTKGCVDSKDREKRVYQYIYLQMGILTLKGQVIDR